MEYPSNIPLFKKNAPHKSLEYFSDFGGTGMFPLCTIKDLFYLRTSFWEWHSKKEICYWLHWCQILGFILSDTNDLWFYSFPKFNCILPLFQHFLCKDIWINSVNLFKKENKIIHKNNVLMNALFFICPGFRQRDRSTYELFHVFNDVTTPSVDFIFSLVHKKSCFCLPGATSSFLIPVLCKLSDIKRFQVQMIPEKAFLASLLQILKMD